MSIFFNFFQSSNIPFHCKIFPCLHLSLPLDVDDAPLLDGITSLTQDQGDFLWGLRRVYVFNLHRICVTVRYNKLLEISEEIGIRELAAFIWLNFIWSNTRLYSLSLFAILMQSVGKNKHWMSLWSAQFMTWKEREAVECHGKQQKEIVGRTERLTDRQTATSLQLIKYVPGCVPADSDFRWTDRLMDRVRVLSCRLGRGANLCIITRY